MSFEVRFTASAGHRSIERHEDFASILSRAEEIIGRLGYDGALKHLSIVIEIPQMEALKAAREAINRSIGELEAERFRGPSPPTAR
jgi:hypothetical protein